MAALSPVLTPIDLPLAELTAARLDGELYSLVGAFCPVDEPERPALRAQALLSGRSVRLIAELGTAAWVWGASPVAPATQEFCADLAARARLGPTPRVSVREVVIDDDDVVSFGRARVTSPLRTAVDLARFRADFDEGDAEVVRFLASVGHFGLDDCLALMERRRNLPAKRRATKRLSDALT